MRMSLLIMFIEYILCAKHYTVCFTCFFSIKTLHLYEEGTIVIIFQRKKIGSRENNYNWPTIYYYRVLNLGLT